MRCAQNMVTSVIRDKQCRMLACSNDLHQIPRCNQLFIRGLDSSQHRSLHSFSVIHRKNTEHNPATQEVKLQAMLLLQVLQITSTDINSELQPNINLKQCEIMVLHGNLLSMNMTMDVHVAETITNNLPTCNDCAASSTLSSVMRWSSQWMQRPSSDHTSV